MSLLLDPRFGETKTAHSQDRFEKFKAELENFGATVEREFLDFGDVAFLGNGPEGPIKVGIELKTIKDLINGMQTKRIKGHQIPGCLVTYGRTYLVVEGFYRAGRPSGILEMPCGRKWRGFYAGKRPIYWAEVEKFLTGLEESGVRVRRTRTPNETARVIVQVLDSFWQKDYRDHEMDVVYVGQPLTIHRDDEVTARIRRVLVALKSGVGDGRSKEVAKRFGSIYGLATADVNAWASVEGIGKTIASRIVQAVREEIPGFTAGQLPQSSGAPARRARRTRSVQDQQLSTSRCPQRRVSAAAGSNRSRR